MPEISNKTNWVIRTYNRCKSFRCLPFPGSLVDQPAWILSMFDCVENAKSEVAKEERENANREIKKAELAEEVNKDIGVNRSKSSGR